MTRVLAVTLLLGLACEGKTRVGAPANAAPNTVPSTNAPAKVPAKAAPEAPAQPPSKAGEPAKAAPAKAGAAGERPDPAWFKESMIGGKKVGGGKTKVDENGLYTKQILFELPEGKTADNCASELEAAVKGHLTLERTEPAPGRIQMKGAADEYEATFVCGEGKGTMRAYVSYRWTR